MIKQTNSYLTLNQGVLPMFISDCLDICDPVFTFDELIGGLDLDKYLKNVPEHKLGRIGYNPVRMLKTVLFGFMDEGYISLRNLEANCKVNVRYMYLMDRATPSYRTFSYFINDVLMNTVEELFKDINQEIFKVHKVDLNHLYIDGSKFEANANKYTWVWKKATEKSRYRLFEKITNLLNEINADLKWSGLKIETNTEYAPEGLKEITKRFSETWKIDTEAFVSERGHRKTVQQRQYEKLIEYTAKLEEYIEKIAICGDNRNSYSKTDTSMPSYHRHSPR